MDALYNTSDYNLLKQKILVTPSERLRYIRLLIKFKCSKRRFILAKLSRNLTLSYNEQLKNLNISESTLKKWESGERNLTDSGIDKCIAAFSNIGIVVSKEWLKNGNGVFPLLEDDREETHLKILDKNSNLFLSYMDRNQCFVYVSKDYCKLFNLSIDKIIGKPLKELINSKSYNIQKDILKQAFEKGERVEFEYQWEFAPNEYKTLRINLEPDLDSRNKAVRGVFSFLEDLSEASSSIDELNNTISQIKECKEGGTMPIEIGERRSDDAIFKNGNWYNRSIGMNLPFDANLYTRIILEIDAYFNSKNIAISLHEVTKIAEAVVISCKSNEEKNYNISDIIRKIIDNTHYG